MKKLVVLLLLLALSYAAEYDGECESFRPLTPRPHTISVLEFGAVGDGKTLNTLAFQNAIFYSKSFADKGGAQLYVPKGRWLIGSINLTSYMTLFLEKDAIILGSQVVILVQEFTLFLKERHFGPLVHEDECYFSLLAARTDQSNHILFLGPIKEHSYWDIVEPGRGIELHDRRYGSLITGNSLTDVVITGDNGTIDGQGSIWWEQFTAHSLNYSRPHLVEFIGSTNVIITNLTFLNAPAWNIHFVYCRNVLVQNVTIYSPSDAPYSSGIVPDSSEHVCIKNSNISTGYDAIALKSGWDEYGIAYGKPTANVHIRGVSVHSSSGSGIAFGSEISGGISNILLEHLHVHDSPTGIGLKIARGRGGYIKGVYVSDVLMENVQRGIKATGQCKSHSYDRFYLHALPVVSGITFKDVVGVKIAAAGIFSGISESPFTSICLSNVSFSVSSDPSTSWVCSNVFGSSSNISPEPCPELKSSFTSLSSNCFFISYPNTQVAVS